LDAATRNFTVHRASDGSQIELPRCTLVVSDRRER
jgi:hypothetical protein